MNYKETTEYIFNLAPTFQNLGPGAYKEGLYNTYAFDERLNHPHEKYKTIHVAGTNGKGSCSHIIAAILQSCGYKVGLYTSPHLLDFRERIRINGEMISEEYVVDFVAKHKDFFDSLDPSFFEISTAMAFKYFEDMNVDVAVIEVGLGGRMDCTNIITPVLSVITNISLDHTSFLGNTLASIASEKSGIIKSEVPVVIGENQAETRPVFESKANDIGARIIFAEDSPEILEYDNSATDFIYYKTASYGNMKGELTGDYQIKNANTILTAVNILSCKFDIKPENVREGFQNVCSMTGLMGRWQQICDKPKVVCDTGHNIGGFEYLSKQISRQKYEKTRIIIGMVNDKDISGVLSLLPKHAIYYFTQSSVKRSLPAEEVQKIAMDYGLIGKKYDTVAKAYNNAIKESSERDFIYVGGSTFIVSDLLKAVK